MNVALGDDGSFEGGHLLVLSDGAVRRVARAEGEATAHTSSLLHAVTMLTKGVRYSLIIFFGEPESTDEYYFAAPPFFFCSFPRTTHTHTHTHTYAHLDRPTLYPTKVSACAA